MGAYFDSLVAARRQRLTRMHADAPGECEQAELRCDIAVNECIADAAEPQSALAEAFAATEDIASIIEQLKVLGRRLGALVQMLPEPEAQGEPVAGARRNDPTLPRPRVSEIKYAVCRAHGLTVLDLEGQSRFPAIVRARQIAMYLARQVAAKNFPDIGRFFGDRNHSTALHAYNKIKRLRATDPELDRKLASLEARIQGKPEPGYGAAPDAAAQTHDKPNC